MSSKQPLKQWTTLDKMALTIAVSQCGNQNWTDISTSLKQVVAPNRPHDLFQPKYCAAQYALLLSTVDVQSLRINRSYSGRVTNVESPVRVILRRLAAERLIEMFAEGDGFQKVQEDIAVLQSEIEVKEKIFNS